MLKAVVAVLPFRDSSCAALASEVLRETPKPQPLNCDFLVSPRPPLSDLEHVSLLRRKDYCCISNHIQNSETDQSFGSRFVLLPGYFQKSPCADDWFELARFPGPVIRTTKSTRFGRAAVSCLRGFSLDGRMPGAPPSSQTLYAALPHFGRVCGEWGVYAGFCVDGRYRISGVRASSSGFGWPEIRLQSQYGRCHTACCVYPQRSDFCHGLREEAGSFGPLWGGSMAAPSWGLAYLQCSYIYLKVQGT